MDKVIRSAGSALASTVITCQAEQSGLCLEAHQEANNAPVEYMKLVLLAWKAP